MSKVGAFRTAPKSCWTTLYRKGKTKLKLLFVCRLRAAILKEVSKESQDWDARAAQEVAAARAQGEDPGALVDPKERRAGLVEAAAVAQAEVPTQNLPAFSGVAAVITTKKGKARRVRYSRVVKVPRLHTVTSGCCCWSSRLRATMITVAFLSQLPSAAARLWQQEPKAYVNGNTDLEPCCPRVRSIRVCRDDYCRECVVPASCFAGKDSERNTAQKFRSLWSLNRAVPWS